MYKVKSQNKRTPRAVQVAEIQKRNQEEADRKRLEAKSEKVK